jgi:hypothetical protein
MFSGACVLVEGHTVTDNNEDKNSVRMTGVILETAFRENLSDQVTFEQRPERSRGTNCEGVGGIKAQATSIAKMESIFVLTFCYIS